MRAATLAEPIDWAIVVASVVLSFIPALAYARRAGKSTTEFFASGRSAPFWLVGVSMVATTFSTDTPNLVANLVREHGVANNWAWWSFLLTGMATVFFYARLWRRSGVLTDLELYELRYAGGPARAVRAFRAVYLGLFFNCVIMASVNLAAGKIANVLFGWPLERTLLACAVLNVAFAATSGLWGVLVTDFLQFGIAMTGAFATAYFALAQPEVGGLAGLASRLDARTLSLLPDFGDRDLTVTVLVMPLAVQWWAVWYPGSEPGGGSYIAQRMLAAKSEKDALWGTLLFNVAHYALRSWPWIVVALASMLVFPNLTDLHARFPWVDPQLLGDDMAYPAMLVFLPAGWLGLMLAGMLAAYVSTMTTHLNWGSSYLVHDFYRRFLRPGRTDAHYVKVSRLTTAGLMVLAAALTFVLDTARASFDLLLSIGAGTGLLYLLRWYWWRINATSEIAAMVASFLVAVGFAIARRLGFAVSTSVSLLATVLVTTVAWLGATFLSPPADDETLARFYEKVAPAGPGWRRVRALVLARGGDAAPRDRLGAAALGWLSGCAFVYAALFGVGSALFGHVASAAVLLAVAVASGFALAWSVRVTTR